MKTINQTKANIKKIEAFTKYLKYNFNNHSKNIKESEHIDEVENSLAFLKDYSEVSEKILDVINDYCKLNGMELD